MRRLDLPFRAAPRSRDRRTGVHSPVRRSFSLFLMMLLVVLAQAPPALVQNAPPHKQGRSAAGSTNGSDDSGAQGTPANKLDADVDSYVRDVMAKRHIPGLALAVIRQGRLERVTAFGEASLEFHVPVAPTTLFHVASVTKSFAAVGVMKLIEGGRVKLDDGIGMYVEGLPESWRSVKVRELLSHTSGLPDIVKPGSADPIAATAQEAIALLRDRPLDFEPGTHYRYCQTDYMLLGLLIEKLSGQSFVEFCRTQLFAPAGLKDPQFGDSHTLIRNRGPIYTPFDFDAKGAPIAGELKVQNWKSPPMVYPNNGLNISAQDLARFVVALMNGKLISRASLDTLLTPVRFKDGTLSQIPPSPEYPWRGEALGGLLLVPDAQHPAAGGTGGPYAAYLFYPKDGLGVVVLTNTQESNPDGIVGDIGRKYLFGTAAH
ncbi:MAG TPA: serine hydrolase domain-containing protein [Steroidobacteraceae bacterium]